MFHVAMAKVSVDGGFTAYQTIKRDDQGGVNGPAYAGNAVVIAEQTQKHNNRVRRTAGLVIEAIEPNCALRAILTDPANPFIGDGPLAYEYIVQHCSKAQSDEDASKEMKKWDNAMMEEQFSVDKFTHTTMHEYIEWIDTLRRNMDAAHRPSENAMCLRLIRGLTSKMGHVKTKLQSPVECPAALKYNANLAAAVFAAGPPMVLAQVARAIGEYRYYPLCDYLKEQWTLGIENHQIHIKDRSNKPPDINFVKGKHGRKSFQKKSFSSKADHGSSSRDRASQATKRTVVCYKCGGIGHVTGDCSSSDEKAPSVKTLVAINYPKHVVFRWPTSFTAEALKNKDAKVSNHISNVADEEESSSSAEEPAADVDDNDNSDSESEDESVSEKAVRFLNESVVRDTIPKRGVLAWLSR